jgi:4-hydroxy-tetrahydrodipicolinate reductase
VGRLLERIRIGIVGLGWVGQEVARAALEDPRVRLVGVADVDPAKAGRDLGEIIGEGRLGLPIDPNIETMLSRARPEVAVLCTTSDVEKLGPALEVCVAHGAHVVTTCENLSDPDTALAQLETGFDKRVRDAGVVVLATGVNPGFAMDRLPVMLTQATRNIRRVRVVRVVNASTRRAQLQAKIGVGMTPHEFSDKIQRGEIGHAGLSSSLRLLAKGLGIVLEKTSEAFTPIIAEQATSSSVLGPVKAGSVRGIYQIARGYRARREVITLELTMALDEPNPRDTIDIVGEPPLHFEGELPGDSCTIATVLSAISVIVTMPAGLRTVLDVPLEQPEEPSQAREPVFVARGRQTTELPAPAAATEVMPAVPKTPIVKAKRAKKTAAPVNGAVAAKTTSRKAKKAKPAKAKAKAKRARA